MSGNVWNRPSGSSMVDMGISSNTMKSPSPKCYMTFWEIIIYSDTLHWSEISLNRDLVTELDLITVFDAVTLFREFSIGHLQWVRLANRGRLLLRTPGPVPFGTCICSNVDTILSWTCHVYGPFEFRTSLGASILLITSIKSFDLRNHKRLLLSRLPTVIRNSFVYKIGNLRYKYLVLCREETYFVKEYSDSKSKYTEEDIIKMLVYKIGNLRYKYLVLCREETYFVKEYSDSKSKYTEEDIIKMLEFVGLCGKGFPTDNRHSHGHNMCPSPSQSN